MNRLAYVALLFAVPALPVSGAVLVAEFSGIISNDQSTNGRPLAPPWNGASVMEGQPWSAHFTYDTSVPPDSGNGPFDTATLSAAVTFGGVTQVTNDARISYSDNFIYGTIAGNVLADSYRFRASFGDSVFDLEVNADSELIESAVLPTSLVLSDFFSSTVRLSAQLETPPSPPSSREAYGFLGSLTSMAVVPEPSSLLLAASALALMFRRRRERRQHLCN